MNYKALIFDLDGTILDSMPVWVDVDVEFMANHDITPTMEIFNKMKTLGFVESAEYYVEKFNLPMTAQEVMWEIKSIVQHKYRYEVGLKPRVEEFLKQSFDSGIKLCVATATNRELAEISLKRLGIMKYFSFILTGEDVGRGKDSPEIYIRAAELMGFPICDVAVFEDAFHGIKTAKNAGFYVVAVYDKVAENDLAEIEKYCDKFIYNYEELL
ncbi:MAG: HAD family phosphatase [Oscillospiraceae bacterium]